MVQGLAQNVAGGAVGDESGGASWRCGWCHGEHLILFVIRSNNWQLSWQCRQHVGDTLATCQKVAKFGSTCMSMPTQKVPPPTKEFWVRNHRQIVDTAVVRTDTVICTYCSTYVPQGVVAIQRFPQNSATIILDKATFPITIEPVCIVVIVIQAALLLRIVNNALGSYVVQYYFLIFASPLLSQLLFSALHHKPQ